MVSSKLAPSSAMIKILPNIVEFETLRLDIVIFLRSIQPCELCPLFLTEKVKDENENDVQFYESFMT